MLRLSVGNEQTLHTDTYDRRGIHHYLHVGLSLGALVQERGGAAVAGAFYGYAVCRGIFNPQSMNYRDINTYPV